MVVFPVGGTILSKGRDAGDLVEYATTKEYLPVRLILRELPGLSRIARVTVERYRPANSTAITPTDWVALHRAVMRAIARTRPAGLVILHGTATLEETAYFLHLTIRSRTPIVLAGAQRPPTGLSSDSAVNLFSAIRVAADRRSAGAGVLVVMNGEIHSAREVTKSSNYRLDAFVSPTGGPLGTVGPDGRVDFHRSALRRHTERSRVMLKHDGELPRVEIVASYAGADPAQIDGLVAAGVDGIVVAGMPPGLPSAAQAVALRRARDRGVLVVQASRASGRVVRRRNCAEIGIVAAEDLPPQKARLLLMLALLRTRDPERIQALFEEH